MRLINSSLEHVSCSNYCSNLVSNHSLIRLIRFVSQFTSKLYNSFLFHLNLILHACKILFRYDRFGILNFATKQWLYSSILYYCPHPSLRSSLFLDNESFLFFFLPLSLPLLLHDWKLLTGEGWLWGSAACGRSWGPPTPCLWVYSKITWKLAEKNVNVKRKP